MSYVSMNIKYLRKKNNLTQEQLAKIVKKDRTLITKWERDDREINVEDIITLSEYFDIPMDYLFDKDLSSKENDINLIREFEKCKQNLTYNEKEIIKTVIEQRKENISKNNYDE